MVGITDRLTVTFVATVAKLLSLTKTQSMKCKLPLAGCQSQKCETETARDRGDNRLIYI